MENCEAETIGELMQKYDEYRAWWINEGGTSGGFDAWFTKQVGIVGEKGKSANDERL